MSTSYYTKIKKIRIGVRQGAGRYCSKCKRSLCLEPQHVDQINRVLWYEVRPICKKPHDTLALSFTWNRNPELLESMLKEEKTEYCPLCNHKLKESDTVIIDEYGKEYTLEEFQKIVSQCQLICYDFSIDYED